MNDKSKELIKLVYKAKKELKYPVPPSKETIDKINAMLKNNVELTDEEQSKVNKILWLDKELIAMKHMIDYYMNNGEEEEF